MQENDKPILIYSTFPSLEAAEKAGTGLVEKQLAACINIIPGMTSIYRWEGACERGSEIIMIIKTRKGLADIVTEVVAKEHPHTVPALLHLPIEGGLGAYLDWLLDSTAGAKGRDDSGKL